MNISLEAYHAAKDEIYNDKKNDYNYIGFNETKETGYFVQQLIDKYEKEIEELKSKLVH